MYVISERCLNARNCSRFNGICNSCDPIFTVAVIVFPSAKSSGEYVHKRKPSLRGCSLNRGKVRFTVFVFPPFCSLETSIFSLGSFNPTAPNSNRISLYSTDFHSIPIGKCFNLSDRNSSIFLNDSIPDEPIRIAESTSKFSIH